MQSFEIIVIVIFAQKGPVCTNLCFSWLAALCDRWVFFVCSRAFEFDLGIIIVFVLAFGAFGLLLSAFVHCLGKRGLGLLSDLVLEYGCEQTYDISDWQERRSVILAILNTIPTAFVFVLESFPGRGRVLFVEFSEHRKRFCDANELVFEYFTLGSDQVCNLIHCFKRVNEFLNGCVLQPPMANNNSNRGRSYEFSELLASQVLGLLPSEYKTLPPLGFRSITSTSLAKLWKNRQRVYLVVRPSTDIEKEQVFLLCQMTQEPQQEATEIKVVYRIWDEKQEKFVNTDETDVSVECLYGSIIEFPSTAGKWQSLASWMKDNLWEPKKTSAR